MKTLTEFVEKSEAIKEILNMTNDLDRSMAIFTQLELRENKYKDQQLNLGTNNKKEGKK